MSYNDIEESIYDLIPQPATRTIKPPMHRSRFPHNTAPTASTFGSATHAAVPVANLSGHYEHPKHSHDHKSRGAHMGPGSHFSDPTRFRKKKTGHRDLPSAQKFTYDTKVRPPVVTRREGLSNFKKTRREPRKDHITQNALAVINAEPRRRSTTPTQYTKKKTYGKVPSYLSRVNREISLENEYIRQVMEREQQEMQARQPQMRQLPEEERVQLLDDLKVKWEAVNKKYQLGSHMVNLDTIGKIRRKEQYESELRQLELAIEKLSRSPVFVQDEA
jgi:hypothetical protein